MTILPKVEADGKTFTITVPNKFTEQDFMNLRPRIEHHLRTTLSNDGIKMTIVVEEMHDSTRYLSPREQYSALPSHPPLLAQPTNNFDLDLN